MGMIGQHLVKDVRVRSILKSRFSLEATYMCICTYIYYKPHILFYVNIKYLFLFYVYGFFLHAMYTKNLDPNQ